LWLLCGILKNLLFFRAPTDVSVSLGGPSTERKE